MPFILKTTRCSKLETVKTYLTEHLDDLLMVRWRGRIWHLTGTWKKRFCNDYISAKMLNSKHGPWLFLLKLTQQLPTYVLLARDLFKAECFKFALFWQFVSSLLTSCTTLASTTVQVWSSHWFLDECMGEEKRIGPWPLTHFILKWCSKKENYSLGALKYYWAWQYQSLCKVDPQSIQVHPLCFTCRSECCKGLEMYQSIYCIKRHVYAVTVSKAMRDP